MRRVVDYIDHDPVPMRDQGVPHIARASSTALLVLLFFQSPTLLYPFAAATASRAFPPVSEEQEVQVKFRLFWDRRVQMRLR